MDAIQGKGKPPLKFIPVNSEPLCSKCKDALPRCCEPWVSKSYTGYGNDGGTEDWVGWSMGKESLMLES
jgi:hypothetical protein